MPHTSIVIPTRNRAVSLDKTLRGIAGGDFEIVVVNNGSTDNTEAVAARYGATMVSVPRPSAAAARNAGIDRASGAVLVLMDDDIRATTETVLRMAQVVAEHPDAFVVGQLDSPPEVERSPLHRWRQSRMPFQPTADLEPIDWLQSGLLAGRRDAFRRVRYSEAFTGAGLEDIDFAVRASDAGMAILFARTIRAIHDDYAGADIAAAWRRTRSNAATSVTFARQHPDHPSAAIARIHERGGIKGRAMRLLGSDVAARALIAATKATERVGPAARFLPALYHATLSGATYRGVADAR